VILAGLALLRWSSSASSAPRVALSSPAPFRNPGQAAELVRRSVDAETANDLPAARNLLLQAIEADPDNAEAHYRLGALLLGSQPERARSEYQAAKRLDAAKYGEAVDAVLKGL